MEQAVDKKKHQVNMCTFRRLNIEHQIDEHLRQQHHRSTLQFHRYREQLFRRKLDRLRKNLDEIEPQVVDDEDDEMEDEALMKPNGFLRIQNHFRLLNLSPQTEKRLLCQAPVYSKPHGEGVNALPAVIDRKQSSDIRQCEKRVSFYQSRQPRTYSCRSANNPHFAQPIELEEKNLQSYLHRQIFDEQRKQQHHDERKSSLLKGFAELKHTIDDPHCTLSVLAALSRALLFLDSGRK